MAKRHVYHWKHGWIPLTHTAAMSKAKGNREKAAELLADAKSKHAGIHTREHVGKSAVELTSIADANERAEALVDVQDAADRLGAVDVLPTALRRPSADAQAMKAHDDFERRNNAHVVARTRPTPDAADYTAAAEKWKRDHPGQKLAGHEREVNDIADDLWRAKRLNGPDTGATPEQAAAERDRIRRAASHGSQMKALGLDKPKTIAPSSTKTSRAKGIVLDGRTDENRYHYRKTDGTLEPQNDAMTGRLKRLEATLRKAERDGNPVAADKARREFASLTGERPSATTYNPVRNDSTMRVEREDGGNVTRPEQPVDPFREGARQHVAAAKHKVGDAVSIRGEANSRVTIVEIKDGRAKVQNAFQTGAKGEWMPLGKLVPYGADTGRESPMGGRPVPGTGSTGSTIRRR